MTSQTPSRTAQGQRSLKTSLLRGAGFAFVASIALASPVFAQSRVTMPDTLPLDWFGYDVAAEGSLSVVGAWRDDDAGPNTGSAHLVYMDAAGSGTYLQKLSIADAAAGDRAGDNVAIGSGYIASTMPGKVLMRPDGTLVHGAVAIFRELNGVYVETTLLDDPARSDGDLFGSSVAIHEDFILVGAPRDDEFAPDGGAVYVFQRNGSTWIRTQKLRPADIGTHDYFGHDLAVAGDHAVATAYNDDDRGVNAGAAYVLDLDGASWSVGQKLTAKEGANFDLFGTAAAMIEDTIVISAPQNQDGDPDAVNDEGAAFVFEWSSTLQAWSETMVLRPGDPAPEHRFGIDIAIKDDVIVVGASHADSGILNSGSAHIFRQTSRDWFEVSRHVSPSSQAYDYLGLTVAIGDSIVIGVPGANDLSPGGGAVDIMPIPVKGSIWGQTYCHSNERVGGFLRMGGNINSVSTCARLTTAGSQSVSRDDLVFRAVDLPPLAKSILFLGEKRTNYSIGDGPFCVAGGRNAFQFTTKLASSDGRMIQRHPIGRIEAAIPGATAALVGTRYYAQVAYYDSSRSAWNSTNAIQLQFEN